MSKRTDLNKALAPKSPKIRNEMVTMIVQYLEDSGYFSSALNLRDEIRLKIIKDSTQNRLLVKLRSAIKSGDWNQIEPLINDLKTTPELQYKVLRLRFLELLNLGDVYTALQFLSTRLREYRKYEDKPDDFKKLGLLLVDFASPSQNTDLPSISEAVSDVLSTIDKEISVTDSPIVEQSMPPNRFLDLLQNAVKFQIGRFKIDNKVSTLLTDFQPHVIPKNSHNIITSGHKGSIKSLAFVPGTSKLLSGSSDKTVKVWDINDMSFLGELSGHCGRVWSIATGDDCAATACSDGIVRLFNVRERKLLGDFKIHSGDVYTVDIDDQGHHITSGGYDQTVVIWDVATQFPETSLKGHSGAVTAVVYNSEKHTIVSGGKDLTVQLWDVRSCLATMQLAPVLGEVSALSYDNASVNVLASTKDSTNRIWDLRQPSNVMLLKGHQNSTRHFVRARFGPSGETVVGGSDDGKIYSWSCKDGKLLDTIRANHTGVFDVVWSTHSHVFASCGDEESIHIWEPCQLH